MNFPNIMTRIYLDMFYLMLVYYLYFNKFTLALPPNTVWQHTTALVDSGIYFTGGIRSPLFQNFFYLDVGKPFKIDEPPFVRSCFESSKCSRTCMKHIYTLWS